jgi:hypothetical protein
VRQPRSPAGATARVGDGLEPFEGDRAPARFADPVGPVVEAVQRGARLLHDGSSVESGCLRQLALSQAFAVERPGQVIDGCPTLSDLVGVLGQLAQEQRSQQRHRFGR